MAKKKYCGVYKITNKENGKIYIGSSSNIDRRWKEHVRLLNNNKHHSIRLQNAWNKYGQENFEFEIIEYVNDKNILLNIEQKWIDETMCYNSSIGYNICPYVASNSSYGENRYQAKLTNELVCNIKKDMVDGLSYKDIIFKYNLNDINVSILTSIKNGYAWENVGKEHNDQLEKMHITVDQRFGENSPNATITNKIAEEIKIRLINKEDEYSISELLGISTRVIKHIKLLESWTDIRPDLNDKLRELNKGKSCENNPKAVLTNEQALLIKKDIAENKKVGEIALEHNVPIYIVSLIKSLKNWKTVGSEYNSTIKEIVEKERELKNIYNNRKIIQKSKDGSILKIWNSLNEAFGKEFSVEKFQVKKCCDGKIKSSLGYVWEYAHN